MSEELIKGTKNIFLDKYERRKLYEELLNRSELKEEENRLLKILTDYFYSEILIPSISEEDLKFFNDHRVMCHTESFISIDKDNFVSGEVYPNKEAPYQINSSFTLRLKKPIPKGVKIDYSKVEQEKVDTLKNIILEYLEAKFQTNCFLRKYCDGNPGSWYFSAFDKCRTLGRLYNINPEFYKVACELFPKKIEAATEYQSIEEAKKAEEVFDYGKEFADLIKELGL